jgi:hypothetical protein
MSLSDRYRVNDKSVAFEMFDGEVLAVNLENGTYYNLRDVSAEIWTCVVSGMTVGETAKFLSEFYSAPQNLVETETLDFFSKMVGENLITLSSDPSISTPRQPAATAIKKPFSSPAMVIYNDMQDLLLLDPVHEVDEAGWPVLKPGGHQAAKT